MTVTATTSTTKTVRTPSVTQRTYLSREDAGYPGHERLHCPDRDAAAVLLLHASHDSLHLLVNELVGTVIKVDMQSLDIKDLAVSTSASRIERINYVSCDLKVGQEQQSVACRTAVREQSDI